MLPTITVTGNLTRDVELSFTQAGKARATFSVACNERRRQQDGSWADVGVVYMYIITWGETAEACAEQLRKGTKVHITGKLRQRSWEDPKTQDKRTIYEVDPDTISVVLDGRRKPTPQEEDPWVQQITATPTTGEEFPF